MAKAKAKSGKRTQEQTKTSAAQAPSNKDDASQSFSHEQIAERARDIWRRKGQPAGQDEQNWLEAIEELRADGQAVRP